MEKRKRKPLTRCRLGRTRAVGLLREIRFRGIRRVMPERGNQGNRLEVIIPSSALLKVAAACLLGYIVVQLRLLLGLLLIAFLIAVTLYPIVRWTKKHNWPRWIGVTVSVLIILTVVGLFFGALIPSITSQGRGLIKNLPEVKRQLLDRLPESGPARQTLDRFLQSVSFSNPDQILKQFLSWGGLALKSLVELAVVLITALYLMVDGPRVYEWLLAFFPETHRKKMNTAGEEIVSIIYSYMAGQLITSVICSVYSFVGLTILRVPDALLLAVLAGICDILPIIGFFIAVIPALLLALTVSPATALIVLLIYVAYHWIENYFIVPKVYGKKLRLSTLTVLISVMAAGMLGGIIGAIAILPIVASYPIIERLWLRPHLEEDTIQKHKQIDDHPPE